MLMLAITPARMKSAPAAVTIQPARLRPFWPWFAAVKPRSAFQRSPEGRGSEPGCGIPSGAAQAGFTVEAGYGLCFRRVKRVGLKRRAERDVLLFEQANEWFEKFAEGML